MNIPLVADYPARSSRRCEHHRRDRETGSPVLVHERAANVAICTLAMMAFSTRGAGVKLALAVDGVRADPFISSVSRGAWVGRSAWSTPRSGLDARARASGIARGGIGISSG
jgi:hypothetical protein